MSDVLLRHHRMIGQPEGIDGFSHEAEIKRRLTTVDENLFQRNKEKISDYYDRPDDEPDASRVYGYARIDAYHNTARVRIFPKRK